jgi:acyl carrier protein
MSTSDKALPTPAEFEHQLAHFINHTLLGGSAAVERDTRLFEDGYMNSLRILDLIAAVEKMLGRRIPDRAVRLSNFGTIATIARAFHPHAASPPPAAPEAADRLFERRGDRTRFTPPIEALQASGELTITGAGQVALSGIALDVFDAVDRTVRGWADALGAAEHRYPSIIGRAVLERAGQVESFPQHLTLIGHSERRRGIALIPVEGPLGRDDDDSSPPPLRGSARNDMAGDSSRSLGMTAVLAPAVCYHAYPEFEGRTIGPDPVFLTACGRCYRYEGGNHVPLERLWEFTMREIIVLGTREQVEAVRQSLVRQAADFVTALELEGAIGMASDPFFTAGDEGRRLMQQAGALKHELQLAVDADGRSVAAASFNNHHDFFGTRFAIRLADGSLAHSGCVAFGLERWVLAVFAQLGTTEADWPAGARQVAARGATRP